jgi:hypothetical protein
MQKMLRLEKQSQELLAERRSNSLQVITKKLLMPARGLAVGCNLRPILRFSQKFSRNEAHYTTLDHSKS